MGGDSIVGLLSVSFIGIVVVAAIYQLGKSQNPIVPATQNIADNTLGALFK